MADARFYVYAVAINGRVRYIGKGTGNRSQTHLTRSHNPLLANAIETARAAGHAVRVKTIKTDLTEDQALRLERGPV